MSPNVAEHEASLKAVSQYQSEVAALREGREPRAARLTIHTLAAMVMAFVIVLFVGQVDRVVSTDDGQIITAEPGKVIQALDPSIIRSIDVKEGQRVAKGADSRNSRPNVRRRRSRSAASPDRRPDSRNRARSGRDHRQAAGLPAESSMRVSSSTRRSNGIFTNSKSRSTKLRSTASTRRSL